MVPATVCDHVLPHRGDEHLFWNGAVQSLCARCHNSAKQAEEAAGQPASPFGLAGGGGSKVR